MQGNAAQGVLVSSGTWTSAGIAQKGEFHRTDKEEGGESPNLWI